MSKLHWPYWLKGTVIFGIIFMPIVWINEQTQWYFLPILPVWLLLGITFVYSLALVLVGNPNPATGELTDRQRIIGVVIILLSYMLFGGLLGYLYGAVKKIRATHKATRKNTCV